MFINTTFSIFQAGGRPPSWIFKFEIPSAGPVRRANMHYHAKCCADRSNRYRGMAIIGFFQMAAVRHLWFIKVGKSAGPSCLESQYAWLCQISCRSLKSLTRYRDFWIFQNGSLCHCSLFPRWRLPCDTYVGTTHDAHLVVFITVQNLVGIDAVVLIICTFFRFREFLLQNAYSRPKIGSVNKSQKRHILAWVHIVKMRENPSTGLTCRWVPQKRYN